MKTVQNQPHLARRSLTNERRTEFVGRARSGRWSGFAAPRLLGRRSQKRLPINLSADSFSATVTSPRRGIMNIESFAPECALLPEGVSVMTGVRPNEL